MLVLLVILLFGVTATLQDPQVIEVQDKQEHELSVSTLNSREYLIKLPHSFKLIIEVENVDLQSIYGDYLLIKRGPDMDEEGTGIALTEKGLPEGKIVISSNIIYIKLFIGESEEGKSKIREFKLKYTAYGTTSLTTTEAPTSTSTWPSPGANDKSHYKAHLYGLRDVDYEIEENVENLRTAIGKMAAEYCKDQAMPVLEPIGKNNVLIADLIRCPYYWPDSEKCVTVNFAVPVVMKPNYEGYQLLEMHLEVMWKRYEKYLTEFKLKNYIKPDMDAEMVYWDLTIIVLVVLLILVLLVIALVMISKPGWLFKLFGRVNRPGDRVNIIEHEERDSCVPNESEFDKFKANAVLI